MPQSNILLDTNSYFRLAQSLHPLLNRPFGKEKFSLKITQDLEKEFKRSTRLQGKFGWFYQDEYIENRSKPLQLSSKQRKQFLSDRDTIINIANDFGYTGLSLEDINAVVYGLLLKIPLVTDDSDLREFSLQMDLSLYKTLELLKLMLDRQFVTIEQIQSTTEYWEAMSDCPKDFKKDYKKLFSC